MRVTPEPRRQELLEEYARSSETLRAWCKAKEIPLTTFMSWRRKHKAKQQEEEVAVATELNPSGPASWAQITPLQPPPKKSPEEPHEKPPQQSKLGAITIGKDGWSIMIQGEVEKNQLSMVLQAVATCC